MTQEQEQNLRTLLKLKQATLLSAQTRVKSGHYAEKTLRELRARHVEEVIGFVRRELPCT